MDFGAAPGGWMQIASALVGDTGLVVGIDLKIVKDKFPNSYFIQGDIFENDISKNNKNQGEYNTVISNLSPKISGIRSLDHQKSIELNYRVLELSSILLQYKGNLLMKIFQGEFTKELIDNLKMNFIMLRYQSPNHQGLQAEKHM